nr:hypothetical protein CFP56_53470 [Quercus suber]
MKFMRHNVRHGKEEAKEGKGVEGFMSQERWPKLGYIFNAKDRLGSSLPRHKSLQLLSSMCICIKIHKDDDSNELENRNEVIVELLSQKRWHLVHEIQQ